MRKHLFLKVEPSNDMQLNILNREAYSLWDKYIPDKEIYKTYFEVKGCGLYKVIQLRKIMKKNNIFNKFVIM